MVKNKPLITIRRDGKFSVPNIDPSHQCGKIGQTEFNFRVEISVDTLDDRGFCVDNFAIPKAFQRKYAEGRWLASCEMLAGGGIYLMHSLSKGRAKRIMVEISPIADETQTVIDNLAESIMRRAKRLQKAPD